jgi:hypothetical protein
MTNRESPWFYSRTVNIRVRYLVHIQAETLTDTNNFFDGTVCLHATVDTSTNTVHTVKYCTYGTYFAE